MPQHTKMNDFVTLTRFSMTWQWQNESANLAYQMYVRFDIKFKIPRNTDSMLEK